jgi:hypothetical protein
MPIYRRPRSQVGQHAEPELGTRVGLDPDPEHVFDAVGIYADHETGGLVHHVRAVADLDHERVDVDDRVHRIQRATLPGLHLFECRVGDRGDGVVADMHA